MIVGLGDTQQIVSVMPMLPSSACSSNQTYVAPGGDMGSGRGITSTGACIDKGGLSLSPLSIATSSFSFSSFSPLIIGLVILVGVMMLSSGGEK